jgi:glycerol-3-phosphate dehydrogenase
MLQWEWLGGLPPLRRAAVVGAGSWGTAVAVMLARAGLEVDLACRTRAQAGAVAAAGENERHLPGVRLPPGVNVVRTPELELSRHDLVCFAVPAGALPAAVARHGAHVPSRAGVLVVSEGVVPPLGTLPAAYVAERTDSWAVGVLGGPLHAAAVLRGAAPLVVAAADAAFRRQVADALGAAGFDIAAGPDVVGVEPTGGGENAGASGHDAVRAA